jgi:N-acyl-D-glutamate deacylase
MTEPPTDAQLSEEGPTADSAISLQDALSKMTIQPARLLESGVPVMRRKGRIQVGADADVTVFDPETISDKGTVEEPGQQSVGVKYVFVVGNMVKSPDGLDRSMIEGQPITPDTV